MREEMLDSSDNRINHSLGLNISGTNGKITLNYDIGEGILISSYFLKHITNSPSLQKKQL